jgi:hypothetical protein
MKRIVGSADLQINAYNPATQFGAPEQSVSSFCAGVSIERRAVRPKLFGEW